jgi:hypothetical protein
MVSSQPLGWMSEIPPVKNRLSCCAAALVTMAHKYAIMGILLIFFIFKDNNKSTGKGTDNSPLFRIFALTINKC